jgi:hypothetical protein
MKITYKKKIIKNLGNYENVTIEIVVEDEVNYEMGQSYENVYDNLRLRVGKSIAEEEKKINDYIKSKSVK